MIQVKTRDLVVGAGDTPERTVAWIDKHCRRAYDQAAGSIRNIDHHITLGTPLFAVPYRARNLSDSEQRQAMMSLDRPAAGWPMIIVVDHVQARGVHPPDLPAFFITFDDLVELMASIRSVTGFLGYVERVLQHGGPQLPLGCEQLRFAEVVAADAAYAAAARSSSPYLTWDARTDPLPVELYRELLERVWREDGRLPEVPLADYRSIVEHLDAVPSGIQAEIGRSILRRRDALRRDGHWQSGIALVEETRAILYVCDTHTNYQRPEEFVGRLAQLANARAVEFRDAYGYGVPTLGVGVLEGDGWLDYQYVLVKEPARMSPTELLAVQHVYGRFDRKKRATVELRPSRNDRCPCGSGMKYKRCCGR